MFLLAPTGSDTKFLGMVYQSDIEHGFLLTTELAKAAKTTVILADDIDVKQYIVKNYRQLYNLIVTDSLARTVKSESVFKTPNFDRLKSLQQVARDNFGLRMLAF